MIAVATQNIDALAETYIRQHIRMIAPGETVVIFMQGNGHLINNEPRFRIRNVSPFPNIFRGLTSTYRIAKAGYSGAIIGKEEKRLLAFLEKYRVRSILAEFGPTGCALSHLCKKAGIKLIVNFHGYDATVMPKRYLIRSAYKKLSEDADAFVCGSKHFKDRLEMIGFPKQKIHVVPCGIELNEFEGNNDKDPNLVTAIGRLTEKKAPHLSIEAFALVKKKCQKARLEIVGDGPLYSKCQKKIQGLDLSECVRLHGAKDHEFVKAVMNNSSVFIQHSVTASNGDTESQGISLLEAMASETPVVTTRHNGFPEVVEDNVTGYLVDEYNVSEMSNKIINLLKNHDLRKKMGKAGRERVMKHFEATNSAKKLNALLLDI